MLALRRGELRFCLLKLKFEILRIKFNEQVTFMNQLVVPYIYLGDVRGDFRTDLNNVAVDKSVICRLKLSSIKPVSQAGGRDNKKSYSADQKDLPTTLAVFYWRSLLRNVGIFVMLGRFSVRGNLRIRFDNFPFFFNLTRFPFYFAHFAKLRFPKLVSTYFLSHFGLDLSISEGLSGCK